MSWADRDLLTPANMNAKSGLVFNVQDEDFGAVGDGVVDDTAAIQAAIDAADNGDTVFVPNGAYAVTAQLNLKAGLRFVGAGASHSTSGTQGTLFLHNGTGQLFEFVGDGTQAGSSGVLIASLAIRGSLSASNAIRYARAQVCYIRDCHIDMINNSANAVRSGGGSCIVVDGTSGANGSIEVEITGNRIQGGRYGVLIQDATTTVSIHDNRIEDADSGDAPSGAGAAVKIEGSDNGLHFIDRNTIESNNGSGVHVVGPELQIQITRNWFELNDQIDSGDQDILLAGTSGNLISRCWIAGNRINSGGVATGLDMRFTSDCLVMVNNFASPTPTSVLLDANSNDNLFLWNNTAGTFTDNGARNIRNERAVVNDLGTNPRLQGALNLLGNVLRDTSLAAVPTFGFASSTPEAVTAANPGAQRTGRIEIGGTDMCGHYVKALGTGNTGWLLRGAGSGTPEANVTALVGSTWQRTDGGAGTSFYVKESGTGNTGWVAK